MLLKISLVMLEGLLFLFLFLIVILQFNEFEKFNDKYIKIISIVLSVFMILSYVCFCFYLEISGKEDKEEYINKIEKILIIENNSNKEIIIEELKKEPLEKIKKYYHKKIDI